MAIWVFLQETVSTPEVVVAPLLEYGVVGILAVIAVFAWFRGDRRITVITDKFLAHLEAMAAQTETQHKANIAAALTTAEAALSVANTLSRLERAVEMHEKETRERSEQDRRTDDDRHREMIKRLTEERLR